MRERPAFPARSWLMWADFPVASIAGRSYSHPPNTEAFVLFTVLTNDRSKLRRQFSGICFQLRSFPQSIPTLSVVGWCAAMHRFPRNWSSRNSYQETRSTLNMLLKTRYSLPSWGFNTVSSLESITGLLVCVCVCAHLEWQVAPSHSEMGPVTLGHHRADQNQVALVSLQTWHTRHKSQIGEDRPALGLLRYPGSAGGRTAGAVRQFCISSSSIFKFTWA